jgi:hypothetical protein
MEKTADLYERLHSLSKVLEYAGRIDECDHPYVYATILDAMNVVREHYPVQRTHRGVHGGAVRDVVQLLRDCADDPMWADHCEMRKSTCSRVADAIEKLRAERDAMRQVLLRHGWLPCDECGQWLKGTLAIQLHQCATPEQTASPQPEPDPASD